MLKITLTKKQYENLVKMVYLGNWMINSIRSGQEGDEQIEKYNKIEQYIFSFAEEAGMDRYIEFDKKLNKFFPTIEFEEETDIEKYRSEYNNETFWEELIDILAQRDFVKTYGKEQISKMDLVELIEKRYPFEEKYRYEFENYGIENLVIRRKLHEDKKP